MDALDKIQVQELGFHYGKSADVLTDISFTVHTGEFLTILGPSGCGKTTLLRLLIGLLKPTSGTILKDSINITDFEPSKRSMGIVFQNYALFENMTVLGNVTYAMKQNHVPSLEASDTAVKLLQKVGLSEFLDKRIGKLSGGQQQRVAIARTLALHPDIILFDEPMSSLDVDTRLVLRDLIKEIQREFQTTMIYVTHDQEEAFSMSDRIMVMNHSKIEQIATQKEIINHPASDFVDSFVVRNLEKKLSSVTKYFGDGNR